MKKLKGLIYFSAIVFALAITTVAQTSLSALDGSRYDLAAQNGKVVVLAIGASWLPLSGKQAEYTNSLAKRYAGKNVVVYFIVTDSANSSSKNFTSVSDMRKFAFDNKLSVPVLHDPDGVATMRKYRIEQVPSFVVIDKNGVVVGQPFGGIDPKYDVTLPISKVVDRLL